MKMPYRSPALSDRSSASLIASLALVALVPVACVLWFMSVAMRNERLAVQQRMAEVYANQLAALQRQVSAFWKERQAALAAVDGESPAQKFAAIVRGGVADGVVIQDGTGKPLYPGAAALEEHVEKQGEWAAVRELEFQRKDFAAAAIAYARIAESADTIQVKARALLAEAVARLKAGDTREAVVRLSQVAGDPTLRNAVSPQGTLIGPNAQLLLVKVTLADVGTPLRGVRDGDTNGTGSGRLGEASLPQRTLDDLVARLNDYADTAWPAAQRRFLMREIKALGTTPSESPASRLRHEASFPTLAAEDLAADYLESNPAPTTATRLERTPLPKVWRLVTADRTLVALFREERIKSELAGVLGGVTLSDAHVRLLAPDEPFTGSKLVPPRDSGDFMPGWRLAIAFAGNDPFVEASQRQSRFYLWTGSSVVIVIALLAWLLARAVNAQMRLARMKNELVSTVSHELKTPLASMRALVDTLLAGRYADERQLRDYLQLVSRENARLSRLIDNFLTFSRLERGQQPFHFEPMVPEAILRRAAAALGEKLTAADCAFAIQVEPDLPVVRGDEAALTTVLVNLLDNACKYTEGPKRIRARAYAAGGAVCFEVADNGIGLAPAERRKIFDRFYQVDQSLTRQRGGCGLGLSIVQSIVRAHGGTVEVESEPGRGSTFRVRVPVAPAPDAATLNAERSTLNVEVADTGLKAVDHGLRG